MSIIDVSRARTFCSATARSLAGLRSAMTTLQEVRHVAAVRRQTGESHAQEREASATINPGEPALARVEQSVASSCCPFLLLHKHSYRKDFRRLKTVGSP